MEEISNQPKVSIMVSVFNVGKYIGQCARSLFEQTLDDLEIIFVDDGSTDDSLTVIEQTLAEFPKRKEQVRIIHHEHNMGITPTRKDALEAARGEYCIYVDGDDWTEPRYAELLYARAKETDADMVMCDYNYQYITGDYPNDYQIWTDPVRLAPEGIGPDGAKLRDDSLNRREPPNLWIRLVRTDFIRQKPILWPPKSRAGDVVMSMQATYYARKIAHVAEPLYNYRHLTTSISHNPDEKQRLKAFSDIQENQKTLVEFMRRENIMEKYENGIFISKIAVRNVLLPIIGKPKYWWKFFSTFPEINWLFLVGNKKHRPTWRERAWILAIFFGLYPKYQRKIKKYFLPGKEWRP